MNAVRPVCPEDASAIAAIYNHYISTSIVTFEETPIDAEEVKQRIASVTGTYPWFVYEQDGAVVGYAYAGRYHARCSYKMTAEVSIYLDPAFIGQGIGRVLFERLMKALEEMGIHVAIGGIALPNDPSIALHESLGFEKAGQFKEVGFKFGRWIDVGFWQKILVPGHEPDVDDTVHQGKKT